MNLPTRHDTFAKLLESLRIAQEQSAIIAHLHNANVAEGLIGNSSKERTMARAWLAVSEALKVMQHQIIQLAQGRMQ